MKEINPEEFRSLVEQGKRLEELMEYYSLNEKNIRDILRRLKIRIKRVQEPKFLLKRGSETFEMKDIENPPIPIQDSDSFIIQEMVSIEDLARVTVEEVEQPWVESQEFEDWNDEDQRIYDKYNEDMDTKLTNDPGDFSGVTDDSYYNPDTLNNDDVDKDLNDLFNSDDYDAGTDLGPDSSDSDIDISGQSWEF